MKNFKRSVVLALSVLLFSITACKKETSDKNIVLPEQQYTDVSYGSDAMQKMDVYLPQGRTDTGTKVIVMIHGGAWFEGDKSDFTEAIQALKSQLPGCAIFNINYRLLTETGDHEWPAQIDDVTNAVNFIASNANQYHVNVNKMIMAGASAGAHLALLEAYQHNTGNKIKAVIDLFGPTDMKALYNSDTTVLFRNYLQLFLNGTPTANPDAYYNASPLFFVNSNTPPTQIFHGDADPVVPISESDSLNNRLTAAGVVHEYTIYRGEGHGWTGINLLDTYSKIINFINSNVR